MTWREADAQGAVVRRVRRARRRGRLTGVRRRSGSDGRLAAPSHGLGGGPARARGVRARRANASASATGSLRARNRAVVSSEIIWRLFPAVSVTLVPA